MKNYHNRSSLYVTFRLMKGNLLVEFPIKPRQRGYELYYLESVSGKYCMPYTATGRSRLYKTLLQKAPVESYTRNLF